MRMAGFIGEERMPVSMIGSMENCTPESSAVSGYCMKHEYQTGLDLLFAEVPASLCDQRVGLLAHPASLARDGRHADQLSALNLVALF